MPTPGEVLSAQACVIIRRLCSCWQVRTPKPDHLAPGGVAGHMGNAAYADVIRRYLDISVVWKAVYATMARCDGTAAVAADCTSHS